MPTTKSTTKSSEKVSKAEKPAKAAAKTEKVESTKKTRKVKAPREGPKKNQSAYLHFCQEERENIKGEETEISSKQILSEMGARWKVLGEKDPERLARCQASAAADKERYTREKAEYDASKSGEVADEEAEEEAEAEAEAEEEVEAEPEPEPVKKKAAPKKKATKA